MTRLLRRRILLYEACALLLLSALVALVLGIPLLESWRHSEEVLLQATVRNKAVSVEAWLRHADGVAWHIAGRSDLRDTLEKLRLSALNPPTTETQLVEHQLLIFSLSKILQSSLRQNGDILGITLVDSNALTITRLGLPIPDALWTDANFRNPENISSTTSPQDSPFPAQPRVRIMPPQVLDGEECLFFSVPVYNTAGQVLANLIIARRMAFLRRILLEESATLHDEVTLGIQTTRGFSLLDAASPLSPAVGSSTRTPPQTAADVLEAINAARAGQEGVLSRGASVIAYAPVGKSDWVLSLRTPTTRLYAPALDHFWRLLPWGIAAYIGLLGGFWLLSRPLAGRILLHTHELEAEVNQRRLAESSLHTALQRAKQENIRRKQLSAELIHILEAMRQSLSSDLHDHVGQTLTTLLLHLENSSRALPPHSSQEVRQCLLDAATSVRDMQQQIRHIARGLRPQMLDILGLIPALQSLCAEMQHAGLMIHFFHQGCSELRGDKALALYRIAQGALTNVVRHSMADSVHISLVNRDSVLVLTIEDNGQGFDAQQQLHSASLSRSLGLTLMQERLAYYDGNLQIESSPGKGTLLVAELPSSGTMPAQKIQKNHSHEKR